VSDHNSKEYYDRYYQKNEAKKRQQAKTYRLQNREKYNEMAKRWHFKTRYGLTLEDIDAILAAQNYKCKLCGEPLVETKRCIDHDHETGEIRGILCQKCNVGLGMFNDDSKKLKLAAKYLDKKGEI